MNKSEKKHPKRRIMLWIIGSIFILISIGALFLYNNFNRLLSDALMKSFNSSQISDVYELKFNKLQVNFLLGNIVVKDVEMKPREVSLNDYSYINSSFELITRKIELKNVEILTLLKENKLKLERIRIADPALQFLITDGIPIFIPFEQATNDTVSNEQKIKNTIKGFSLKEFQLENASLHVINSAKQRDLSVKNLNISVIEMFLDQNPGKDIFSYNQINLSVEEISGSLQKEALKYISLKDYSLSIDQLKIQKSIDTMIYHFDDLRLELGALDLQTSDSIFHITMQSFNLSYKDKSLILNNIAFKPNISDAELQKRYKYQNTQFSGSIGTLKVTGINYDSFIYNKKLIIDNIALDSVKAFVYKDKTKPIDSTKFPKYLGQLISAIKLPLLIKEINATNVTLLNTEIKPDGTIAKANLTRAAMFAGNITNLSNNQPFIMKADAYLEDKAHFNVTLGFDYQKPQFSIDARFDKFNLPDISSLITAYTPASILTGIADDLTFSGTAYETKASGTMSFLYHDLKVDLKLKEQAKWKSSVLAFAANEVVNSANPSSQTFPPRIVQFQVDRDMNKGFINIVIKSALNGLKETIIMSKENRKTHKEAKKEARQKAKEESKK
jgi:hypothetical protein